jgi:hypothetical protein
VNKFPAPQSLDKSRPCSRHQIRDRKCSLCAFAKATLTADFLSGKLEHIAAVHRTIPPCRFTPIVRPLPRGVSASYEQIGNSSRTSQALSQTRRKRMTSFWNSTRSFPSRKQRDEPNQIRSITTTNVCKLNRSACTYNILFTPGSFDGELRFSNTELQQEWTVEW